MRIHSRIARWRLPHDFQQFARLEPGSPEGGYLLGLLDLTAGRLDSAVEHFRQAIKVDDKMVDAYYYMAEAYFKNRQYAQAKDALVALPGSGPHQPEGDRLASQAGEGADSQRRK